MSLFSLANRSAAAHASGGDNFESLDVPTRGAPPPAAANAIERLVEFIPIETITIFWLAVPAVALVASEAAAPETAVAHPNLYDWCVYFALLVLTPALLLLKFLSQAPRGENGKPQLPPRADWPWWKMAASALAFALWALAVPGNPFLTTPGQLMLMWAVAAAATAVLGYVDKIVSP